MAKERSVMVEVTQHFLQWPRALSHPVIIIIIIAKFALCELVISGVDCSFTLLAYCRGHGNPVQQTGAGALSAYRTLHAVHMLIRLDQRAAAHKCMCVQSDLAYPVLLYPDTLPSGRKSLVTD